MTSTDTQPRPDAAAELVVEELFFTEEGRRDPHPRLHRLRDLAPVHRSERMRAWLLTGYDNCRAVLRDPRFERRFAETMDAVSGSWRTRSSTSSFSRMMLMTDPPDHSRLRKRVARAFTPRRVQELRPRVDDLVVGYLDEYEAAGGGDFMEAVAFRLPIAVIGELLGVPDDDRPLFREPVLALTQCLEVPTTREQLDAADEAYGFCASYFADLIAERRAEPTDDLVGALITDGADDALDDDELNDMLLLLFVAGFETTTNLIGNALVSFIDQPEQYELLRAEPDLAANLAPELLRHDTPLQLVNRVATEDVEVGGRVIPAGDSVFVMLGAANRDPNRFESPDVLDLTRTDVHPLAFGGGIHHCLGAALATAEVDALFRQVSSRFPTLDMAGDRPRHRDRLSFRGVATVELSVGQGADASAAPVRPSAGDLEWRREYRRHLDASPQMISDDERRARVRVLASSDFFAGCSDDELAALAETSYPLAFDAGELLVRQGEPSPDAFVIAEGTAEVVIDGEVVAMLGPDAMVGERGVLTGETRAATVTATSHLGVQVLSTERLRSIIESNPDAVSRMREFVTRYDQTGPAPTMSGP
jgi:cytochrome P450